jgi:hypothetical protein
LRKSKSTKIDSPPPASVEEQPVVQQQQQVQPKAKGKKE